MPSRSPKRHRPSRVGTAVGAVQPVRDEKIRDRAGNSSQAPEKTTAPEKLPYRDLLGTFQLPPTLFRLRDLANPASDAASIGSASLPTSGQIHDSEASVDQIGSPSPESPIPITDFAASELGPREVGQTEFGHRDFQSTGLEPSTPSHRLQDAAFGQEQVFEVRFDEPHPEPPASQLALHTASDRNAAVGESAKSSALLGTKLPGTHPNSDAVLSSNSGDKKESDSDETEDPTIPAGRGWMDKMGAKTVVVAALLLIASATYFSGRQGRPNRLDDQIVDTDSADREKPNFAQSDAQAPGLTSSPVNQTFGKQDAVPTASPGDPRKDENQPASHDSSVSSVSGMNDGSLANETVSADEHSPAETTSPGDEGLSAAFAEAIRTSAIADSAGLHSADVDLMPPSPIAEDSTAMSTTATPNAITDWLQYLPGRNVGVSQPSAQTVTPNHHVSQTPNDPMAGYRNYLQTGASLPTNSTAPANPVQPASGVYAPGPGGPVANPPIVNPYERSGEAPRTAAGYSPMSRY
ncbi:MAG: hypothetical protein AAF989_10975 [Planctomycetota bacterium]